MNSDATFEKIRGRMAKIEAGQARTVQNIYKFVITKGGEKKVWILDLKADKLYVGDDANAECTLTMDDEVMVSLGNGSLTTQDAVSQGKLSIDGSLDLALKLSPFVSSL